MEDAGIVNRQAGCEEERTSFPMGNRTMEQSRITPVLLALIALVAVGAVLKLAQSVVLPLVIAWLLSYVLAPVVIFLTGRRVPLPLAIFFVLVLLFVAVYSGAVLLNARVSAIIEAFPRYQERFSEISRTLDKVFQSTYNPLSNVDWGEKITVSLVRLSGSLVSILSSLVMVFIFLIFMLSGQPYFKLKVVKAFSSERAEQLTDVITSITSQITRYLSVQFLISLATGICIWAALLLIGVDFPITWGALAFFLNFIPTVGSIIACIPPILLALVQFYPELWPAVVTFIAVLTIQLVIGNGIAPKVMGERLNLSPVVVLVSLLFWGWLWGVVGALLSIPITTAIKIGCENIPALRPISVLMGSGKKSYLEEKVRRRTPGR
jgi:AI-2 transport protein TqsA